MAQRARVLATESDDLRWTQGRNGMLEKENFIAVPESGRSGAWSEESICSTGEAFPNTAVSRFRSKRPEFYTPSVPLRPWTVQVLTFLSPPSDVLREGLPSPVSWTGVTQRDETRRRAQTLLRGLWKRIPKQTPLGKKEKVIESLSQGYLKTNTSA